MNPRTEAVLPFSRSFRTQRRTCHESLPIHFDKTKRPKAAATGRLEQLGLKVSGGYEYRLEDALLPGVTSIQAREALKGVSGSMLDAIVEEHRQA